jgi:hypothetical protein
MNYYVYALVAWESNVIAAGNFTAPGGNLVNRVAMWDGSQWIPIGPGLNNSVSALAVRGNDLYVGGDFTVAGGKGSAYVARVYLLPLPVLSIVHSDVGTVVSWPSANTADFALEETGSLNAPGSWSPGGYAVSDDGSRKWVTLQATNDAHLFRLRR